MSVLLVKNNVHAVVDMLDLAGLMVAHLLVEITVALLLHDRVETPVVSAIELFDSKDRSLRIAFASVLFHDPQRGDALP